MKLKNIKLPASDIWLNNKYLRTKSFLPFEDNFQPVHSFLSYISAYTLIGLVEKHLPFKNLT